MTDMDGEQRPLIFVSYSHRDDEAKAFINRHLGVLRNVGDIEVWSDDEIIIGDDWYQEIETNLQSCAVAVLLISADFLGSEFCIKKEVRVLLERRKRAGMMIAPILLRPCAWKIVPWLAAIQMQPGRDKPLLTLEELEQEEELAKVVIEIHNYLEKRALKAAFSEGRRVNLQGRLEAISGGTADLTVIKADTPFPALPAGTLDITRLPVSGYDIVGRDDELRMLDEAFDGDQLNIVSLVAWGGVGKSTLVNKWCEYLAADNYRGARRVFAWSFYSQGTNERVTSADAFIDKALRFFGEGEPAQGSPWARGERLAELVGQEKVLLLLDGMEPLQDKHQGIKDPALSRLVECLAAKNAGLCVITTREPVKEISDFDETTCEKNLEQLSKEAGRALLRIKGIRGSDAELEAASEAFGNHALAINLLASFLRDCEGKHIRYASEIPALADLDDPNNRHPRQVMAAFAERFGDGPELDLLHMMGLFDRPADGGCIAALRKEPALPGLTEKLSKLDEAGWLKLLARLRSFSLLAPTSHHDPDELDAHPLVREHFGARLQAEREDAWKAGHLRLYKHLQTVPEKDQPDTLADMAPLFQAVHHGCAAGRYREACNEVYKARIIRDSQEYYLTRKLGAFGADLGVISSFFIGTYEQPAAEFSVTERAWLLNQAAFRFRALGLIREAVTPFQAALEYTKGQEDWNNATINACNLSELLLALGQVGSVLRSAVTAVTFARHSNLLQKIVSNSILADIWHLEGYLERSESIFKKAEYMQREYQPQLPKLYSYSGFLYCQLLLNLGNNAEALDRAHYILDTVIRGNRHLLDIGLGQLSSGQATLALGDKDKAKIQFDHALESLRDAGSIHILPWGLLARSVLLREVEEFKAARCDLDEAMRIAKRGEMRLHQCDAHLEYARLALAEGKPDAARVHLKSAAALVSACGYHRRDGEVAELEQALAQSPASAAGTH